MKNIVPGQPEAAQVSVRNEPRDIAEFDPVPADGLWQPEAAPEGCLPEHKLKLLDRVRVNDRCRFGEWAREELIVVGIEAKLPGKPNITVGIVDGAGWTSPTDGFTPDELDVIASTPTPASAQDDWKPTHRHKKRGSTYVVVGQAQVQCEDGLTDYEVATVYRGHDGQLWVRRKSEFEDGRFEALSATGGAK